MFTVCDTSGHRWEQCLSNRSGGLVADSEATLAFWTYPSRSDPFIFLFHLDFISKTTFDTAGMIQAAWTLLLLSLQSRGEGGNDKRSSCPFNSRRFWICECERGCWGKRVCSALDRKCLFSAETVQSKHLAGLHMEPIDGCTSSLPQNRDCLLWSLIPAALISKLVGGWNFHSFKMFFFFFW